MRNRGWDGRDGLYESSGGAQEPDAEAGSEEADACEGRLDPDAEALWGVEDGDLEVVGRIGEGGEANGVGGEDEVRVRGRGVEESRGGFGSEAGLDCVVRDAVGFCGRLDEG